MAKKAAQRRLSAAQGTQQQQQIDAFESPPPSGSNVKNIHDFSVMKRYLRTENQAEAKIVIEVTKVDASGNVLLSETVCADEFRLDGCQ